MSNSVAPLRTERNLQLVVLASHVYLMVEIRLTVPACRHLLVIHLALFLIHLGLVFGRDLATSLVNLTASLMDLTIILTNLTVVLTNLTVVPVGSGTVVLLDSGLAGTACAGTNLSIQLDIIESSRHRYREDKS